jgi:flagellar assembly protein FliH
LEDIAPGNSAAAVHEDKVERSALDIAEAEAKKLRSELRGREADLAEARELCGNLRARMEADHADLDRERAAFRENSAKEAADLKESARVEGHEEGRSKGYGEGMAKAEEDMRVEYEGKFSRALVLLQDMVTELGDSRERLAVSHTSQLIRLWNMMLQRMLSARVEIDPEAVMRMVENLLKRISDRERIIVYLNPSDITMIEESKERLMDSIRGVKFFELMSDDHVDKGSCLIETNLGIYDARWRTQLEQVSSEVQNLLMESMASDEYRDGER